jgi:hypothetical protein
MHTRNALHATVALLCLAVPMASRAHARGAPPSAIDRAEQAAREGRTGEALTLLELNLRRTAGRDRATFGRTEGAYWRLISREGDYARAFSLYEGLASEHPADAESVAGVGSAIGGLIGWLHSAGYIDVLDEATLADLDARARAAFARALELDPQNFSALLGVGIYDGFSPGGATASADAFHRLDALRASHPEYPWKLVSAWETWLAGPRTTPPPQF